MKIKINFKLNGRLI